MDDWIEIPCTCGFTHEKNPEEFENYELEICKTSIGEYSFPKVKIQRCKTCETVPLLKRVDLNVS